jgi:ParB family chromosome partitioning protein
LRRVIRPPLQGKPPGGLPLKRTAQQEVTTFLTQGGMGHALVIARLKGVKAQREMLKDIIREKYSVENAEFQLKYQDTTIELSDTQFDKSDCKGCNHNGGEQSLLFGTGSEIKGICLDKKCFMKKVKTWVAEQTKKLKDKGVNVMSEKAIEKLMMKTRVGTYDTDYKSILKRLHKEPETFAVMFEEDWAGRARKTIWCIKPSARHPKKKATPKQAEAMEKEKAQQRVQKLGNKVSLFKEGFLISKTRELMKPSTKESKAMTLFALLKEGMDWNDKEKSNRTEKLIKAEKIYKTSYGSDEPNFSKILALDESDIDRLISTVSGFWVKHLYDELNKASETFGVNLTEHFQITEEYLKPYTKDALVALAKEIGLDKHLKEKGIEKWDKAKRADLQGYFLNEGFDLKGKVPKLMAKAT